VSAGFEFGFLMEGNPEFQINDIIEFFEYKEEAASL